MCGVEIFDRWKIDEKFPSDFISKDGKERERQRECMCVCVKKRKRERERERGDATNTQNKTHKWGARALVG